MDEGPSAVDFDPARGARLARARHDHGWSQVQLAKELREVDAHFSQRRVDSLERAIKRHEAGGSVSRKYRQAYARAHGLSEADLFGTVAPAIDEDRLAAVRARPSRFDTCAVESLAQVLQAQRRLEDAIGSAAVLSPVLAQLDSIERLLAEARGPVRPLLLDVAAQWCQFAAWLAADTRQLRRAELLCDRTITWATEARNPNMIASALNLRGHAAWRAGRTPEMITRSEAAFRERHTSPGVRALAAQQAARGHAIAGDAETADHLLDVAADLITTAAANHAAEPPWLYFYDPAYLSLQRARAYLYLPARHERAIDLLTKGIGAMPPEIRRSAWTGSYLIDLATGYHAIREYDQADRVIAEALTIAEHTGAGDLAAAARSLAGGRR